MEQPGACPGDDRAHGRVHSGPRPGHFTAVAAVISPLGSGTWACGHERRDAAVGVRGGAGRGDRNARASEGEKWQPNG